MRRFFNWIGGGAVGFVLSIVFDSVMKKKLNAVWPWVLRDVETIERIPDLTGQERRDKVFWSIKDTLKADNNTINLAIELAVAFLRKVNR